MAAQERFRVERQALPLAESADADAQGTAGLRLRSEYRRICWQLYDRPRALGELAPGDLDLQPRFRLSGRDCALLVWLRLSPNLLDAAQGPFFAGTMQASRRFGAGNRESGQGGQRSMVACLTSGRRSTKLAALAGAGLVRIQRKCTSARLAGRAVGTLHMRLRSSRVRRLVAL